MASDDVFSYIPSEVEIPIERPVTPKTSVKSPVNRVPQASTLNVPQLQMWQWTIIAVAVVFVILVVMYITRKPAVDGFTARRSRGKDLTKTSTLNGISTMSGISTLNDISTLDEIPNPIESMCGGSDQMCPCAGNETMVGKKYPYELTADDLSQALAGR